MITIPIWRDYWVELPSSSTYEYRIKDTGGNVIYNGRAVAAPGAAKTRVRVNDICAEYMAAHSLPTFTQDFTPQMLEEIFSFEYKSGNTWTSLDTWAFIADWSYDYDYEVFDDGLDFPIKATAPRWGHLFMSVGTDRAGMTAVLNFADGSHINKVITVRRTADFNADFNDDFAVDGDSAFPYGVVSVYLASYPGDIVSVELNGTTFAIEDCRRYALHYVNAYGGWDTFVPARYELMQDTYTRKEMRTAFDNSLPENRGIVNYANEIARGITFRTGALDDFGGGRMHHLLGSTCVYLEDTSKGIFYPVNIKDTNCDYKTFRNQGGKRVEYTFSVKLAHDMIRR